MNILDNDSSDSARNSTTYAQNNSPSSTGGGGGMGPNSPTYGSTAEANESALAAGAATGGYGTGGWASAEPVASVSTKSPEPHPDSQAYSGWSAATAEAKAQANNVAGKTNTDEGLTSRVQDKMRTLGIRAPGTTFADMEKEEAANPSMKDARLELAGRYMMNGVQTFMPGMGLLNTALTGANMVNDVSKGNFKDAIARIGPGLVNTALNKASGGLYGKASLVLGAGNELNSDIPTVPNIGGELFSAAGIGKPKTSIAPGMGPTVSGGTVSPSPSGDYSYDTGGWANSGGGSYKPAPVAPIELLIPEATPIPATSTPLDTRLFRNKRG